MCDDCVDDCDEVCQGAFDNIRAVDIRAVVRYKDNSGQVAAGKVENVIDIFVGDSGQLVVVVEENDGSVVEETFAAGQWLSFAAIGKDDE